MQANTIEKIELVTAGSAKYDAAGGGVINIVLKKGKNLGFNATVTGTAGYGKYYKALGGVVFNNRTEKFNVFGSFNTLNNKAFHDFMTDRVINYNNVISDYHVDYNGLLNNHSNSFSFGTDYFLSSKQTLGFLVNGDFRNDEISKNNKLTIWNNGHLDSTIIANSSVRRNVKRQNYNLNYNRKLDKAGTTLSADFNYTNYSAVRPSTLRMIFLMRITLFTARRCYCKTFRHQTSTFGYQKLILCIRLAKLQN